MRFDPNREVQTMLERWQDFYMLVGTAAAALIALLFVAVSIGVGVLPGESHGPTRTRRRSQSREGGAG